MHEVRHDPPVYIATDLQRAGADVQPEACALGAEVPYTEGAARPGLGGPLRHVRDLNPGAVGGRGAYDPALHEEARGALG